MELIHFNSDSPLEPWRIVNDVVMGGLSQGSFTLNKNGHGVFNGQVSLENNGGFSMVQYQFETINVNHFNKIKLRLKGDGKSYQFRVKTDQDDYYAYVASFTTSGVWETIDILFECMVPKFRGKQIRTTNYPGEQMTQLAFLIGNKKAESFELIIESITLE